MIPRTVMTRLPTAVPAASFGTVSKGPKTKPPLVMHAKLKDGRDVVLRRLMPSDLPALNAFMDKSPFGMGDQFTTPESRAERTEELLWMADHPNHDAIVAIVGNEITGLAEIDPRPYDMEQSISASLLDKASLSSDQVCVARMVVVRDHEANGVGTLLKKAQVESARNAGLKGVTSQTSSSKVKAIVEKVGGIVDTKDAVTTWTLLMTSGNDF